MISEPTYQRLLRAALNAVDDEPLHVRKAVACAMREEWVKLQAEAAQAIADAKVAA